MLFHSQIYTHTHTHSIHIYMYVLLPKLPSVDLQNALSTDVVSHPALLLIKELSLQPKMCGNGPVLMQLTGLTVFPGI